MENRQGMKRRENRNPPPSNQFESRAFELGYSVIAGVDEVGRGCLAGPVVAACVVLPWQDPVSGIRDSKQLTSEKREVLFEMICHSALDFGVAQVEPEEIDRINILRASLKAMYLAVASMKQKPSYLLVDGNQKIPQAEMIQETVVKGDQKVVSIAAASIVAKVTRDRLMLQYHETFPAYDFGQHKGYGTQSHLEALKRYGPTNIHRRSFRGVL